MLRAEIGHQMERVFFAILFCVGRESVLPGKIGPIVYLALRGEISKSGHLQLVGRAKNEDSRKLKDDTFNGLFFRASP